jgi:hypothetical protein
MSFEATAYAAEEYDFTMKPKLMDADSKVIYKGTGSEYTIAKTSKPTGDLSQINQIGE